MARPRRSRHRAPLEWPSCPAAPCLVERAAGPRRQRPLATGVHPGLRLGADLRGRLPPLREGRLGQGAADVRRRPTARRRASWRRCPEAVPAPRLLWLLRRRLGRARHRVRRRAGTRSRPWRPPTSTPAWTRCEAVAAELTPAPDGPGARHRSPTSSRRSSASGTTSGPPSPDLPHLEEAAALAAALRRGDRRRHRRAHRRARRQLPDRRRRPGLDLRLELAGRRRRLARLAVPADRPARRRPRRRGGDRRAAAAARRTRRAHRHRARAARRLLLPAAADEPVPPTSPYLRDHQRWQGEVCWAWLCERRGWAEPAVAIWAADAARC